MESNYGKLSNLTQKKENQNSIFSKNPSAFVVAFSLRETYDDLVTAQQMICNKRSPQPSNNSITPTNSLQLLQSTHTIELDHIPNSSVSNEKVLEENTQIEIRQSPTSDSHTSQLNLEGRDIDRVIHFIDTDAATDSSTEENTDNPEKTEIKENFGPPEIIFNAVNYAQRCKNDKSPKKKSKLHKVIIPKSNKFKCKTAKNGINNRIQKYYETIKQVSSDSTRIREGFSNISTVISRTRVLKNVLAKENLLDGSKANLCNDSSNINENDDSSLSSYPSTAKNTSFISNLSRSTLIYKSSNCSIKQQDLCDSNIVKSATKVTLDTCSSPPYKTDVINVAIAVAYNKSKTITDVKFPNTEKLMHLSSLTSQSQPLPKELSNLTSKAPSDFEKLILEPLDSKNKTDDLDEMSDITLVNKKSSFNVSSDDTFDMARTSSDFNEGNMSAAILKIDIESKLNNEVNKLNDEEKQSKRQNSILETVINLGYYPEMTASSSSGVGVPVTDQQDIYITDMNQNYHVCSKNMGDHKKDSKVNANILKKQFDRDFSPTKKPVNLPNHEKINEMLTENKQMKNAVESKIPFNIPEMWDKLIIVLDVAFKRLETTITDKIVRELKASIASLEYRAQPIPEVDGNLEQGDIVVIEPPKQEIISTQDFKETNRSVLCNLVQSEVIDEIMQSLSTQEPKTKEPEKSVKSIHRLKSNLIQAYLDVLKPPIVVSSEVVEDKADTVTVSTVRTETFDRVSKWTCIFFGPMRFIRENWFIIISVPAFFMVLVLVYGILTMLIKPL